MGESDAEFNNTRQISLEQRFRPKSLDVLEKFRFAYKKPTVEGRDNLPPGPCVIAATHLSGFDVPEVYAEVAKDRKTGAMQSSTFRRFWDLMRIESVFTVASKNSSSFFNVAIIEKMKDAINKDGRTLIVAAHNPTEDWKLAEKPGLAAVIIAHFAKVPVVPAALDIQSKTRPPRLRRVDIVAKNLILGKKPDAKIIIGSPMSFPEIPDDRLQLAMNLYSPDKRRIMTGDQILQAQATLDILKSEAGEVMKALASNLPPEKRGKWG